MDIRWQRTEIKDWNRFSSVYAISKEQAQRAVEGILSHGLADETAAAMGYRRSTAAADVSIEQQGHKFAVYKVDTGQYAFILVLSGGSRILNRELRDDCRNLGDIGKALEKEGLPVFVPRPYAIGEYDGVPGFSVEYLGRHLEAISRPATGLSQIGVPYTEFVMNSDSERAARFNENQTAAFTEMMAKSLAKKGGSIVLRAQPVRASAYYQTHQRIKKEIIARLYVVNMLTGYVPREFSVNAGDFMTDPDREDFDPYLTTIRGGWKGIESNLLPMWLFVHTEPITYLAEWEELDFPLFDHDKALIAEGIELGKNIMKTGTDTSHLRKK